MIQSKEFYTKLAAEKLGFAERARSPEIATMYYSATAAYAAMAAIAPRLSRPRQALLNELNQAGHDPKEEED